MDEKLRFTGRSRGVGVTREIGKSREAARAGGDATQALPVALLIDDDQGDLILPDEPFTLAGCRPVRCAGLTEVQDACAVSWPALVFMPLSLGGKLVSTQLIECLSQEPAPVIVVVASNDQINAAAEAMRLGAYDCLFKPFSQSRLTRTVEAAVNKLRQAPPSDRRAPRAARPARPLGLPDRTEVLPQTEARPPEPQASAPRSSAPQSSESTAGDPQAGAPRRVGALNLSRSGFVASSAAIKKVLERAMIVARSDAAVFISGEIGTGKSTFAKIVHDASPRADGPMVTLSCATLTVREFEAQVFGRDGAFARAAEGTLYLDEIADLPAEVQSRFAHIIESIPPGRTGAGPRFIGSTVHTPSAALQGGLIRPELFYRLHVAPLALPPLRQRDGDAALAAQVRLAALSEAEGRSFTGFSDNALAMISDYAWPGNLRELVNVIQTIVLMNQGPLVTPELLPPEIRAGQRYGRIMSHHPNGAHLATGPTTALNGQAEALVGKTLAEIERTVIEATIQAEDGSVPRAARVLDVAPSTLYRKREAWAKTPRDAP